MVSLTTIIFISFSSNNKVHAQISTADPSNLDQDVPDDWQNYAKNPQRTSYTPTKISPPLELKWRWSPKAGSGLAPVLRSSQGFLASGAGDGNFYIFNAFNGSFIKTIGSAGEGSNDVPFGMNKYIFMAGKHCYTPRLTDLYNTLNYTWTNGWGGYGEHLIYNGKVLTFMSRGYVTTPPNAQPGVMVLDLDTHKMVWSYPYPNTVDPASIVDGVIFSRQMPAAKDANTGKDLWPFSNSGLPSGEPGAIYFYNFSSKTFVKADPKTGAIIQQTAGDFLGNTPPAVSPNLVVYVGQNKITVLDKETWQIKWSIPVSVLTQYGFYYPINPVISQDILYFINAYYQLQALDLKTGNFLSVNINADQVLNIALANKMLYLVVQRGTVRYIEAYTGQEPTPRIHQDQEVLNVEGGKPLTLDASSSFAATGKRITKYSWNLGDGNVKEGQTITHIYSVASALKEYQISLTVTDSQGVSASKTIKVEVTPFDTSTVLAQNTKRFYYDLAKTKEGNLILFYSDQNSNLVYQVSTDKGKTWTNAQTIASAHYLPNAFIDSNNNIYLVSVTRDASVSKPKYWFHKLTYQGNNQWSKEISKEIASSDEGWSSSKDVNTRYNYILKDNQNKIWFFYTKAPTKGGNNHYYRTSDDQGLTWSPESSLVAGESGTVNQFEVYLWNGKPIVFFSQFFNTPQSQFAVYYWTGSQWAKINPENPKALSQIGNNPEGRYGTERQDRASFLVHPFSQSLEMIYKVTAQMDHQGKDDSLNNNWQLIKNKVTPTHGLVPDDQYPYLFSDGLNTYLLYGEWVRRDADGHHYNVALKKYNPSFGWKDETVYISQDAGVNIKPISLKDISGLDYLPVVWQEKQESGIYTLKFKTIRPSELISQPRFNTQQSADKSIAATEETLTYTLNYKNIGLVAAKNLIVKSYIPTGTMYVPASASSGGVYNSVYQTVTWNIGDVQAGQQASLSFKTIVNFSPPAQMTTYSEINYQDTTLNTYGPLKTNFVETITDVTPPVISNLSANFSLDHKNGSASAIVSWTTNEPSNSIVEYGQDTNYGNVFVDYNLTTSHKITSYRFSNLYWFIGIPGKTYHYRVGSIDQYGNKSLSPDYIVTLPED